MALNQPSPNTALLTRNFSLYPEQDAVISLAAKEYHLNSTSAAIRFIIMDWMKLKFGDSELLVAVPVEH